MCTGCTDPEACNYDAAILDDGPCVLPDPSKGVRGMQFPGAVE